MKSEDSYTDAVTEGQSSSSEHKRYAETARVFLECKCLTAHTFLMKLCPRQEAGSMLIVSFVLFLLPHLAAALVIRLVDAVLALRGFMKS